MRLCGIAENLIFIPNEMGNHSRILSRRVALAEVRVQPEQLAVVSVRPHKG